MELWVSVLCSTMVPCSYLLVLSIVNNESLHTLNNDYTQYTICIALSSEIRISACFVTC